MSKTPDLERQVLHAGDPLDAWDRLVDASPQGTLFSRPWWLEAVTGGPVPILTLRQGERLVAGMPLPRRRRLLWSVLTMPPLTQTLGPVLAPEAEGKYVTRLSRQVAVLRALVDALPSVDLFRVQTHPSLNNWLPFHWAGYQQTTRYTYVLDDLSDLEAVRANAAPQLRTKLRKAEKSGIRVSESQSDELDLLLDLNERTFAHLGTPRPYPEAAVRRLDAACAPRDARTLLVARDPAGRPHAALLLVHDRRCMYNLVGGTDPELRASGANHLTLWRALELAHARGVSFDFCGSMLEGVESFNRAFGGELRPYFQITRCRSLTARLALGLRDLAAGRRARRGG